VLYGRQVIGHKLAAARVAAQLTQEQAAEKVCTLGVRLSAYHFASIERGRKQPSPQTLAAICAALDIEESAITKRVRVRA